MTQLHEGEPSQTKGKEKGAMKAAASGTQKEMENKKDENARPDRTAPSGMEVSHNGSIAIDDMWVEEIRKLRRSAIVTVIKGFAGLRPHEKVKDAVAELVAPDLKWTSQPFEDDRILLHCPSEDLAKQVTNMGEMKLQEFTIRCEPCKAATNATGKADGELRWITASGLPLFGMRRDLIARLLKPVGDLVYLGTGGAFFVGHCRAAVRIRKGKRLPTTLNYSILTEKFSIKVQLDQGEPPLPWDLSPEKMVVPEVGKAKGGGVQPQPEKKDLGPPGKDQQSQPEVTKGMTGYGRSSADATACNAAQEVRRATACMEMEKSQFQAKQKNNGVKRRHMEADAAEILKKKTPDQTKERQVDKNAVKSSRGNLGMKLCRTQKVFSHTSTIGGQMEQSQPLIIKNKGKAIVEADNSKEHVEGNYETTTKNKSRGQERDTWQHGVLKQNVINYVNEANHNINEKSASFPTYLDTEKDNHFESDKEFDDQLIREIELEMENMWNTNLDGEGDKMGDNEAMVDLTTDNPIGSSPKRGNDSKALEYP
ncbi:hypothetical protein J5N97_026124 [Dioscorea zingiberensis]|uniref:Uncharacterized protein n=1 Tax=Dioscorea zingiberensis TaxID=325984 RepID=A0A9D5C1H0_9LILI|nr:hypothetical protein J5N97_026124 [Dioscorea zingiberensis]